MKTIAVDYLRVTCTMDVEVTFRASILDGLPPVPYGTETRKFTVSIGENPRSTDAIRQVAERVAELAERQAKP